MDYIQLHGQYVAQNKITHDCQIEFQKIHYQNFICII